MRASARRWAHDVDVQRADDLHGLRGEGTRAPRLQGDTRRRDCGGSRRKQELQGCWPVNSRRRTARDSSAGGLLPTILHERRVKSRPVPSESSFRDSPLPLAEINLHEFSHGPLLLSAFYGILCGVNTAIRPQRKGDTTMNEIERLRNDARAIIAGCDGSNIEGAVAKLAAIDYALEDALARA